jgi:hypothetical protein
VGEAAAKRRKESDESEETRGYPEIDLLIAQIPIDVIEEHKRKLKSGFKLFQLANRDFAEAAREPVSKNVDRTLNKVWNQLSLRERRYYQDRALKMFSPPSLPEQSATSSEPPLSGRSSSAASSCIDELDSEVTDDAASSTASGSTGGRRRARKPLTAAAAAKEGSSSSITLPRPLQAEMLGVFKKESCCIICEEVSAQPGDLVRCRGVCQNAFHMECLRTNGMTKAKLKETSSSDWKCTDCSTGRHACLLCKSYEGIILRCNASSCGRFFHADCLKTAGLWPQARYGEKQLTCPSHICHTCASDNPREPFMRYNKSLIRCIRCPTAYHSGDFCVTAGTVQITSTQIVCPKHFTPLRGGGSSEGGGKRKSLQMTTHLNANWCFICAEGGTLICCERCPTSFHAECLNISEAPEGHYYCDNCETGRMPLYNEIVWVKLGHHRWWPARVIHPTEVPDNVERSPHAMGEFPIKFCGTNDYYWINHGRCFLYEEGDSEKVPMTSGSKASFIRGIKEAAQLFEKYCSEKDAREAANADKVRGRQRGVKPPLYTKIKTNRPFGDCPIFTESDRDQQCECTPQMEHPCGPNSECLNRILMTECPQSCPTKDKCLNRRFQKRVYPSMEVARTNGRGWGLYIKDDVKQGNFIIEYVGELITMEEFKQRSNDSAKKDIETNFYYMTMDSSRMIDAGPKGNSARFMNHSCNPNCETQKWTVNGDTRVGLFATVAIQAGSELTFNYQFEALGEVKKPCLCGAKNCSGLIGKKPRGEDDDEAGMTAGGHSSTAGLQGNGKADSRKNMYATGALGNGNATTATYGKIKLKVGRKPAAVSNGGGAGGSGGGGGGPLDKSAHWRKEWEDYCFRCFDEGELLMCDYKTCPKVYHLACLGREKMPREKWFCPWHHCVHCGKPAVAHCMHCPNAYCKSHDTVLTKHPQLATICDEHEDDMDDTIQFYGRTKEGVKYLIPHPNVTMEEMMHCT